MLRWNPKDMKPVLLEFTGDEKDGPGRPMTACHRPNLAILEGRSAVPDGPEELLSTSNNPKDSNAENPAITLSRPSIDQPMSEVKFPNTASMNNSLAKQLIQSTATSATSAADNWVQGGMGAAVFVVGMGGVAVANKNANAALLTASANAKSAEAAMITAKATRLNASVTAMSAASTIDKHVGEHSKLSTEIMTAELDSSEIGNTTPNKLQSPRIPVPNQRRFSPNPKLLKTHNSTKANSLARVNASPKISGWLGKREQLRKSEKEKKLANVEAFKKKQKIAAQSLGVENLLLRRTRELLQSSAEENIKNTRPTGIDLIDNDEPGVGDSIIMPGTSMGKGKGKEKEAATPSFPPESSSKSSLSSAWDGAISAEDREELGSEVKNVSLLNKNLSGSIIAPRNGSGMPFHYGPDDPMEGSSNSHNFSTKFDASSVSENSSYLGEETRFDNIPLVILNSLAEPSIAFESTSPKNEFWEEKSTTVANGITPDPAGPRLQEIPASEDLTNYADLTSTPVSIQGRPLQKRPTWPGLLGPRINTLMNRLSRSDSIWC